MYIIGVNSKTSTIDQTGLLSSSSFTIIEDANSQSRQNWLIVKVAYLGSMV
jgi:hypothetical protein